MSKLPAMTLAAAVALSAFPAFAAPADRSPTGADASALVASNGRVIGRDPDPSIRSMILRDERHETQ